MWKPKKERGEFTIDVDLADFDYQIAEIELEAPSEEMIPETEDKIITFAKKLGFAIKPTNGKICEWIQSNNPSHYETLVKAGVFGSYKWKRNS